MRANGFRSHLVGRVAELAELDSAVQDGALVTVTGPGGVGKTALVTELLRRRAAGATYLADLSTVERASSVGEVIAEAVGQPSYDALVGSELFGSSLLVIDNCEHVLEAVASVVADLRLAAASIAFCATSRQPLGISGEIVLALGPLAVPPPDVVEREATSVELFLATATRSNGRVTDDDLADVCELCRRLDGLPLAIEIAATRTRSMSPREILRRLGDELDRLEASGARRQERHRSIRDAVEWSYRLLEPGDQDVFDRLGLIAGRFTAATARTLVPGEPMARTLDRLDRLVNASLLEASRGAEGTTWYRQLESIKACARDHLEASGEVAAVSELFVDHMVAEARELATHARSGWQPATLVAITAAQDSFLQALRWALEHDEHPTRAIELLSVLWGHQSRTGDVLALGRRALARWPDPTLPRWADAAATVAACEWIAGNSEQADRLIDEALAVEAQGRQAPALLRRVRGQLRREAGQLEEALEWLDAAAAAASRLGLRALVMDAQLLRAATLTAAGDIDGAVRVARTMRQTDDGPAGPITELLSLSIEADAQLWDDPAEAVRLSSQARPIAERAHYHAAVVGCRRTAALGHLLQDEPEAAAAELAAGLEVMLEHGTLSQARTVLEAAAVIAHRRGLESWGVLATTASAVSAPQLLSSALTLLPPLPSAAHGGADLAHAIGIAKSVLLPGATPSAATPPSAAATAQEEKDATVDAARQPSRPGTNRWMRQGDHWLVEYDGTAVTLADRKGYSDLARLLARPELEVPAVDLIGALVVASDTGEAIDATARRQYEARVRDLRAEIAEAEAFGDVGRVETLGAEVEIIVEHLGAAFGLGGRPRAAGSNAERARTAVTRRIRTAIAHTADRHPALSRHLRASVVTGATCAYRPERTTSWLVEA